MIRRLLPLLLLATLPAGEADPVTTLSKVEVRDSLAAPEREAWRYGETPHFVVLSQASDAVSQMVVGRLEAFESLLDIAFPTFLVHSPQPKVTLILCTSDGRFKPFETSALDSIVLLEDHHRLHGVVVDMKLGGLTSGEYEHLERSIVLARMANLHPRYPVWFEEGMAQIAAHMHADAQQIVFNQRRDTVSTEGLDDAAAAGALSDPDTALSELTTDQAMGRTSLQMQAKAAASTRSIGFDAAQAGAVDQDFFTYFNGAALLPLEKLFSAQRGSPDTLDPSGEWAKECWAFTDYCLYANKESRRGPLTQFLRTLEQNPLENTATAFQASFGQNYTNAAASFRGYLQGRAVERVPLARPPAVPAAAVLQDATDGQIARIKGDALLDRGNLEAARREYLAAYRRGERDPGFLVGLGAVEARGPDAGRAEAFLAASLAARPSDEARIALARLRLNQALAAPAAGTVLSKEQTAKVFEPLLDASPQVAADPGYFDLVASIWAHASVPADRGQLALLVRGCRLYPDDTSLILDTAAVVRKAGYPDIVKSLLQLGEFGAADEASRGALAAQPRS